MTNTFFIYRKIADFISYEDMLKVLELMPSKGPRFYSRSHGYHNELHEVIFEGTCNECVQAKLSELKGKSPEEVFGVSRDTREDELDPVIEN